jgi:protein O-GlcNAc transferase
LNRWPAVHSKHKSFRRFRVTAQELLQKGAQQHQSGRLDEAEEIYRRLLAYDANDADALHLLGLLLSQRGDPVAGRELIRRAIAIRPTAEVFHVNYGSLSAACGLPAEAVAGFQKAIELNRNSPAIVYAELGQALASLDRNTDAVYALEWAVKRQPTAEWLVILSEALQRLGRQQDALDRLEQAIHMRPDMAEARGALGLAMEREGRLPEAERCYRDALTLKPDLVQARNNLAHVLNRQQRWSEAAVELERAIKLRPDFAQAHHNLGVAMRGMDRLDEAAQSYHRAVELNPNLPMAWVSLGNLLMERRQLGEAADALRRAVVLRPTPGACVSLGRALGGLDRFDEALAALRQAVELAPGWGEAHLALGAALQWCGEMDGALAAFRQAVELEPKSYTAGSQLLYGMLFHGGFSPEELFSAHVEWARRHTEQIVPMPAADIDLSPSRRLRVGYVSPNFRNQAIMSFVLPMIANHDSAAVEIYCYSDTRAPDAWTARLREHADQWRDTGALSDLQLAERIRADRVDILVDLTGHIGDGRLRTFAAKPAPIQVAYLGYQATTGLGAMDYFLTDDWADPVGRMEEYFTEQLERIPDAFFCYEPPTDAPEVGPLPATANERITFGCQNNLAKVTPRALALWCRVLAEVPNSKLLLLAPDAREVDDRIRAAFASGGISSDRIELVRRASPREYLDRYNRIDIALDPVPFNGHTTTCDAAWMGCPTVMLAGAIFPYRYGGSVLRNLGLKDLIAENEEEYVRIAVGLAADRQRLLDIRSSLRETMRRSPITDAPQFSRKLELAFRRMWELHTSERRA